MGLHLRKENLAFTKAASIPARRQIDNAGPRLFVFLFFFVFFDAAPHLLKRHVTLSEDLTPLMNSTPDRRQVDAALGGRREELVCFQ